MLAGLGQIADLSSGASALGLDFGAFVVQLLTFVVIFLILKRWAFGPIVRKLEQRRELIENGVALGETMKAERAKLAAEITAKLQSARAEADEVLATAKADARKVVEAAEDTAKAHTTAIVQSAHRQIAVTANRERQQLERELVHLVSDVSEAVIGQKLDAKHDAGLVDAALRERKVA